MLDSPVRVALLARPGDARDQLRRALAELGAQLVAEGDPAELDPGTVAGEKPSVVLVSLEPALEDSLSRFDDLLAAPGVEVMYDDAEVTRQLDGWDLARWARHLAAKLVGSDLLPPPPGGADHLPEIELALEPGAPPTPAQEMANEKLEDYAAESLDLSEWVPSTPSLAAVDVAPDAPVVDDSDLDIIGDADLDLDLGDLEQAMGRADAEVQTTPRHDASGEDLEFDPSNLDIDLSALPEEGAPLAVADEPEMLSLDDDEPLLADVEIADGPVNFSSFSEDEVSLAEGMDDDVAALAAQLDAFEANDQRQVPTEPDFSASFQTPEADPAVRAEPAATAPRSSGFGSLELMPMDAEISAGSSAEAGLPPPLAPAPGRAPGLSLADAESAHAAVVTQGALLVFAGLGGPDAVRQLLSALPPTLPVPVLLYQHLDTGKHDRLVGQLAKASKLPLDLAVEGKLVYPGRVAVLPPGVGIHYADKNFTFTRADDLSSLVAALPVNDSVVLMLSGAAPSVLPAVLALQSAGGRVLAQTPASCFDATAAEAVLAAGAEAADPPDLARLIIERWS